MPGTLASLLIKLGLDATGVEQGVARAEKSIGGLSIGAGTGDEGRGHPHRRRPRVRRQGRARDGGPRRPLPGGDRSVARRRRATSRTRSTPRRARPSSRWTTSRRARRAIRTDLGLTGEAARRQPRLVPALRAGDRAGRGRGAGVRRHPRRLEPDRRRHHRGHGHAASPGSRPTAASITDSQDVLAKLAPVLQGANMDWQQGTELINLFNAAGVDASAGITGITKALGKVESPEELQALLVDIAPHGRPLRAGPEGDRRVRRQGGPEARAGAPGIGRRPVALRLRPGRRSRARPTRPRTRSTARSPRG